MKVQCILLGLAACMHAPILNAEEETPPVGVGEQRIPEPGGGQSFQIGGYFVSGYTDQENDTSAFDAKFVPVFLWQPSDKVFFEAEVEFEINGNETETVLEYAQAHYLVNNNLTLGFGKILIPFGQFGERIHPSWINKLPDMPIAWAGHDAIIPMSDFGMQARGGAYLNTEIKINYSVFVVNGPEIHNNEEEAGGLGWGSNNDENNNKAIGARFGIIPKPNLEFGVSLISGKASGDGVDNLDVFLWGMDFSYLIQSPALLGSVRLNAEYATTSVDKTDLLFDDLGNNILVNVDNDRTGWYAQAAYRPDQMDGILSNYEAVLRLDGVIFPDELNEDRERVTLGVNYWTGDGSVLKLAYQIDSRDNPDEESNAFFAQFAVGF